VGASPLEDEARRTGGAVLSNKPFCGGTPKRGKDSDFAISFERVHRLRKMRALCGDWLRPDFQSGLPFALELFRSLWKS
jgi:hypothetical protein